MSFSNKYERACLYVQEQAANLLSLKPQLDAAGYKLVVVSIGYPQVRAFHVRRLVPTGCVMSQL
eukprot:1137624-Pelagomonas_calceolata.AAC.4